MFAADGTVRSFYRALHDSIAALDTADLTARSAAIDRALADQGITFSLSGTERPLPLDLVPRVIPAAEWAKLERGVAQRVRALEAFLADVYGEAQILRDGVVPYSLITSCAHFHREAAGIAPALAAGAADGRGTGRGPRPGLPGQRRRRQAHLHLRAGPGALLPEREAATAQCGHFRCWLPDELGHVLDKIDELVVKPVEGSGGYGIVFGPNATAKELAALRRRLRANPRGWIGQPVMQLSTVPARIGDRLAPRHVDLRPFAVNDGTDVFVLPGGLTRVALPEGSLVVNSSQGGGSKDTWVLASQSAEGERELDAATLAAKSEVD